MTTSGTICVSSYCSRWWEKLSAARSSFGVDRHHRADQVEEHVETPEVPTQLALLPQGGGGGLEYGLGHVTTPAISARSRAGSGRTTTAGCSARRASRPPRP